MSPPRASRSRSSRLDVCGRHPFAGLPKGWNDAVFAMVLQEPGQPLVARTLAERTAGPGEILARVVACAVCRTDLHVVDGELREPKLPLVPGHEIVARVLACGPGVEGFAVGSRIGIPWLGWSCGVCPYCR